MKKSDFLKRLQQGNVLRSAISYVAVSWLILQACSLLFPLFEIGDSYIRLIFVGLIILFPIWLLLTYLYDFTSEGITKTDQSVLDEETILKSKARLNRTIITVLCLAIILLILDRIFIFSGESGSDLRSIAVIPFSNISGNNAQSYFVDGMQDELIGTLAMVKDFRITSKTSTNQYKKTTKSIQEIAKELSVDAIIEGSVLLFQNSLRIQIKLIKAFPEEQTILSQTYDKPLTDVLKIYKEVTMDVAEKVKLMLSDSIKMNLKDAKKVDPIAYDLYLKGRSKLNEITPLSIKQGLSYFEKAKEIDPKFFGGYSGISSAYLHMMVVGMVNPLKVRDLVMENAQKGVEMDPYSFEAQSVLANAYVGASYDWENGEKHFLKSLNINSSESSNNMFYAHLLACLGRFDEANFYADRAIVNDPFNPFVFGLGAVVKAASKRYNEADSLANRSIELDPSNPFAYAPKNNVSKMLGEERRSFEEFLTFNKLIGNIELAIKMDSIAKIEDFKAAYNFGGQYLEKLRKITYVPPHAIYQIYSKADNTEKVLEWLQKGYEERCHDLAYIGIGGFSSEV